MLQHLKIEDNAITANPYQKFCCLGLKLKNYFNFLKKKERTSNYVSVESNELPGIASNFNYSFQHLLKFYLSLVSNIL